MNNKKTIGNVSQALHIARACGIAEATTWANEEYATKKRRAMRMAHFVASDGEAARAFTIAAPEAFQHRAGEIEAPHLEDCVRIVETCHLNGATAEDVAALLDDLASTGVDLF